MVTETFQIQATIYVDPFTTRRLQEKNNIINCDFCNIKGDRNLDMA